MACTWYKGSALSRGDGATCCVVIAAGGGGSFIRLVADSTWKRGSGLSFSGVGAGSACCGRGSVVVATGSILPRTGGVGVICNGRGYILLVWHFGVCLMLFVLW